MSNQRSKETGEQTGEPAERILRPAEAAEPESLLKPKYVNSWALVVGITRYEHTTKLDYAVDDARAIAELLVTGLGFPRENVFVILDPPPDTPDPHYDLAGTDASKAAIEDWLCTRLPAKAAGPDDRVLFFYAGHGESRELPGEPKRYKGYLVPADGRPGAWHTLIETDDVIEAGDFCEAKHLFYLFDSCFSGLAVARSDVQPSPFETVMLTNRVRMGLTAGTAKQTVADRGPGGHSPFTNFVLLGLQGEAAQMAGQVITGSDLILYVRNQVAERYGDKQTPDYGKLPGHESGGDFLFLLPAMGLTPKEQYQLGCDLYALGRIQDDEGRIESSAGHFKQAMRQSRRSGEPFPEAQVQLGRSFIALGRHKQAAEVLRQVPAEDPGSAQASFYLGIALAKMGDDRAALEAFERLHDRHPDEEKAAWAGSYAEWLRAKVTGERYALLIGVNKHADQEWKPLPGPATDVQLMQEILTQCHGFHQENIVPLLGEEATCQGIRTGLDRLIEKTTAADTVVIHFSGHGFGGDQGPYLIPYDFTGEFKDDQWQNVRHAIDADELHRLLQAIPAAQKLLVLDTDANIRFLELARQEAGYAVFVGAGPGEQVYEGAIEPDSENRVAGHLTYGLVQTLRDPGSERATYSQILDRVRQVVMSRQKQRPLFVGNPDHFLFGGDDPFLDCFDFAERRNYASLSASEMPRRYGWLTAEVSAPLPEMHLNCGRALLEKGEVPEALEALRTADRQSKGQHLEASMALGAVQVLTDQHDEATASLARAAQHAEAGADIELQIGRMLLLLRDYGRAGQVFEEATRRHNGQAPLESWFHLALAQARRGDNESASAALETYLQLQQTKEGAAPHRRLAEWLAGGCTKHALLIGIGEYEYAYAPNLLGPPDEVRRLREVLTSRYGFPENNVISVVDKDATFQGVKQEFERLSESVLPGDVVVVFYSGHVSEREVVLTRYLRAPDLEDVYWTYDYEPDQAGNSMLDSLLDSWLKRIPTEHKIAILDPGYPGLLSMAGKAYDEQQEGRYGLLVSASPGQTVWEGPYEHDGQRVEAGLFAHHFIQRLWAADPDASTVGQIVDAVADDIRGKTGVRSKGQSRGSTSGEGPTPQYVGDRNSILFSPGPDSMDLLQRAAYVFDRMLENIEAEAGARELLSYLDRRPAKNVIPLLSQHITAQAETDAAAYLDLGIAHAAAGELEKGIAALTRAVEHADKRVRPEARYHLGRVLLEQGQDLDAAVSELRQAVEGDQENARAHYYLGQALLTQARRDIFAAAAEAFRIYLEGGAPLGDVEEVQEFLRSRAPEQDWTTGTR